MRTLRKLAASESDVLRGIEDLCSYHPAVARWDRANCGRWRIVRPPNVFRGPDWHRLESQISTAISMNIFTRDQFGWVEGMSEGTPDLMMVMRNGYSGAFEVKRPGGRIRESQMASIKEMQSLGAFAHCVSDLDDAKKLLDEWAKRK